jgi:hypothetical protein
MPMTGTVAASQSLECPALALAFASVLAGYTAWEIGQLSLRRSRRSAASSAAPVASRIVMGVTMSFMLLIMV